VRIAPPMLFEEPAQSRWFCTECGTPCEGEACPNCGLTKARAFGMEVPVEEPTAPVTERIPEPETEPVSAPQAEEFPETERIVYVPVEEAPEAPQPEAPQAEEAEEEKPHWFCIACGTLCEEEICPSCGTTRAKAFGMEAAEEKPLEPVFEIPVTEEEPEEIPLFTLDTQPEPAPEPVPVQPEPPVAVPRYVKLTQQWDQNGWKVYDYLFVTYDADFTFSCAQAIMDEAGRVDNATRIPVPGAPEEDITQLLIGCGRNIWQCPSFIRGSAGLGIGVMTQGMTVKTFLNPGTNRITVMAAGDFGEETVSRYLNSIIHQALRN